MVHANDNNIDEFTKWLLENGHSQYVKEGDICKEYKKYSEEWFDSRCEEFPKGKMGIINNLNVNFFKSSEIPWDSNPNKDTLLYYLFRYLEVELWNIHVVLAVGLELNFRKSPCPPLPLRSTQPPSSQLTQPGECANPWFSRLAVRSGLSLPRSRHPDDDQ